MKQTQVGQKIAAPWKIIYLEHLIFSSCYHFDIDQARFSHLILEDQFSLANDASVF